MIFNNLVKPKIDKFNYRKFLADYIDKTTEPFNPEIIEKKDEDIIYHLRNVIYSIEREKPGAYSIKVQAFNVIDDYRQIQNLLHRLEAPDKRRDNRVSINVYDYIQMKDSAIRLVEVEYLLTCGETKEVFVNYIAVPRLVDKYYFKISGNYYSSMYQIVESTYNNAGNNKQEMVSIRPPMQMKISIYKKINFILDIHKNKVKCTAYNSSISIKNLALKYILAKFGMVGAFQYMGVTDGIFVSNTPVESEDFYCFEKNGIYISSPIYMYDNCEVIQSFIFTILSCIEKDVTMVDIFNWDFWLVKLAGDNIKPNKKKRNNKKVDHKSRGESILFSFENLYDISTKEDLKLPIEEKSDMYAILRWMLFQFNSLKMKDNTDLTMKRIRWGQYIAAEYAQGLVYKIFSISNDRTVTVDKLRRVLSLDYMYLIKRLKSNNLLAYKNNVNDNDLILSLKYTFKGTSGIGDKKGSSVPTNLKFVKISHMGILDRDTSSNSDPGMSGLMCPYVTLYNGTHFSNKQEPSTWREELLSMKENYRQLYNVQSLATAEKDLLGLTNREQTIESADMDCNMVSDMISATESNRIGSECYESIPLNSAGTVTYDVYPYQVY